jgi:general stress protein 26
MSLRDHATGSERTIERLRHTAARAIAASQGMLLAWSGGMGMSTATIEMRSPEEHRERLHDLVKATRTVIVLPCTPGEQFDGQPMSLVRTGDDTTMYLAASLDGKQASAFETGTRVTVVVQGAGYAVFSGEVRLSRDPRLIDELWSDSWRAWCYGKLDRTIAIIIVSPIEGSYWEGAERHSYIYRLVEN